MHAAAADDDDGDDDDIIEKYNMQGGQYYWSTFVKYSTAECTSVDADRHFQKIYWPRYNTILCCWYNVLWLAGEDAYISMHCLISTGSYPQVASWLRLTFNVHATHQATVLN